jgi:hypothetical protein
MWVYNGMTKKYLEVKFKKNIGMSKKLKEHMKMTFNQARNAVCKDHDEYGDFTMLDLLQWLKLHQPLDYDTIMYMEGHKRPYELCKDYGLIDEFTNGDIFVSGIGHWVLEKGC